MGSPGSKPCFIVSDAGGDVLRRDAGVDSSGVAGKKGVKSPSLHYCQASCLGSGRAQEFDEERKGLICNASTVKD